MDFSTGVSPISSFFFCKFGLGKVFCDVLDSKVALFDPKNIDKKRPKLCFFKGVRQWFGQKFEICLLSLFREIWPGKGVWLLSR